MDLGGTQNVGIGLEDVLRVENVEQDQEKGC